MLTARFGVKPIQCYSLAGLTEMQRVLDDIAENPGLVRHLVLSSDVTGVFNTAGAEVVSRLEFSRQIAETFGLDASLMDGRTLQAGAVGAVKHCEHAISLARKVMEVG
jgi:dTDP-4-dehydrorhamnose reductase